MSEYQSINEIAVDRRDETVVTQEPGYVSTERVTRDVAAERRINVAQVTRILWTLLALLEISLGLRFLLKLIAANPNSGFASVTYGLTELFVLPFTALTATWTAGANQLEVTTLIAMMVYALFAAIAVHLFRLVTDRSSSSTMTRTTREQTAGGAGNVRTTHTTSSR